MDPLFSIIIPLEFHRGQWKRCWQAWNAQTVDKSIYEIILVVPHYFQEPGLLNELSGCRLEFSSGTHDMDLCVAGAARARGRYLVFTEAHCWPEPDALELCQEAIDANPDWVGFSCLSIPTTHNWLSEAEAGMYEADIAYAMQVHPWRKILDQCFVTDRDAYERCGGFQSGLGHFAEWLLAADYFQHGYKLGYFPKARFHHYYSGSLSDLKAFTLDFVTGEMRYFGREHDGRDSRLFEIPPEWICQGNFDRDTARAVVRIAVQSLWPLRESYRDLPRSMIRIGRWIIPAIFGDRIARVSAAAAAAYARIVLLLAIWIGSRKWLNHRFTKYVTALIRAQRLATIETQHRKEQATLRPGYVGFGLDAFTLEATGFYPLERHQGIQFRWSETAAAVVISAPAGRHKVRIDCLPVRDLTDARSDFRFYIDGARISSSQLSIEADRVNIDFNLARPQIVRLGWTCLPLIAVADPRQLGLPVEQVDLIS
ncbi:glycosyltransferase [Bradyrhizobium sediminis]|uniref:Glycosyltransferase n=1 Tax=Bradyrhizobium sediminis TaxID=2840469 RepID=A0A975NL39_9BRAD|nr:glycosyltransferase [Bradyrhizobium sediminis]QWG17092.1 glycosyltransferase [Bradyrhizobium sediminis]